MIKVALKGPRGAQGPRPADRPRGRHRRLHGERHVRAHRHHAEGLRRHLRGVLRRHRRRHQRLGGSDPRIRCSRAGHRSLPSVETAAARTEDLDEGTTNTATLLDHNGKIIGRQGESMGIGISDHGRPFSPLKLKQGAWAHGAEQVVIDAGTARKYDFGVGEKIKVAGDGPARAVHRTGIATFGSIDNPRRHLAGDLRRPDRPGPVDKAGAVRQRVDQGQGRRRAGRGHQGHQAAARQGASSSRPATNQAAADAKDTNESLKFITLLPARLRRHRAVRRRVRDPQHALDHRRPALARVRDAAHARCLTAARSCARSVIEGLIVGLVASVLGLALGLGIAKGMTALFAAMGVELPQSGTVFASRTVIVSYAHGHAAHARGEHRPRPPCDPRRADLGRARGPLRDHGGHLGGRAGSAG